MNNSQPYIRGILRSYSQVFFSENLLFAGIILGVSFLDPYAGLFGLLSVITANSLALILGYNKQSVYKGFYGFNALLTGLGMGLYYQPSIQLGLVIMLVAVFVFFITLVFQGVFYKYALPYLSLPFLAGIWLFILSTGQLTNLGLSERGIYQANELYGLGGIKLLKVYDWCAKIPVPSSLKTYFYSLGAIFFQYNMLSGILLTIGLLIYSRISFSLSLIGFYIAYIFYAIVGANFNELSYNYIGFNYILTAIALGGYFYVPRKTSYLLVALILPIVVLITLGLSGFFKNFNLPLYSLPFNVTVLFVLYALKLRERATITLHEPIVQHLSPERNLYYSVNQTKRFGNIAYTPLSLPFWGEWKVSQGHDGEYTHQKEWRHAWDFVITDSNDKQYKNNGDYVDDYYCYGKNIISPADGEVIEILDGIEDNIIGEVNIEHNWGNTIVIKHSDYLYSKLCHIQKGSLKVEAGQRITKGEVLAQAGNSGHSPYPHLHFQVQATPSIGSPTLDYPLQNYLSINKGATEIVETGYPKKDCQVSNPDKNDLLKKAFYFIPGKTLKYEVTVNNADKKWKALNGTHKWKVETDIYKNRYITCEASGSRAFFYNNGTVNFFTDFTGTKNTFLFLYAISIYKSGIVFRKGMKQNDSLPIDLIFSKTLLFLQDFIAPLYRFLKVDFTIEQLSVDDELMPQNLQLHSEITTRVFGRSNTIYTADIMISNLGIEQIIINTKNIKITAQCCE